MPPGNASLAFTRESPARRLSVGRGELFFVPRRGDGGLSACPVKRTRAPVRLTRAAVRLTDAMVRLTGTMVRPTAAIVRPTVTMVRLTVTMVSFTASMVSFTATMTRLTVGAARPLATSPGLASAGWRLFAPPASQAFHCR